MMSYATYFLYSDPPSKILRSSPAYDYDRQQAGKLPQRFSHRPAQPCPVWARHDGRQRTIEIQK